MGSFESLRASCAAGGVEAFVVLGSGMNQLTDQLSIIDSCPFRDVPGFPSAGVVGHRGALRYVKWGGRLVLVSEGRFHYYEGHPWDVVVRPILLAAALGARAAILTNAAGGIREDLEAGSLMPLCDHLEWNRPNPWREPARPSPYSKRLLGLVEQIGGTARPGIYASVTGPSYETPAEIRALRSQGADAVGMSTTREALAGVAAGMEVAAFSLVTNRAAGLSAAPLDHAEVLAVGRGATDRLGRLLEALLARL